MVKALLKHPLFMMGSLFIVLVFAGSIVHAVFFDSYIPETTLYFEGDTLIADAPLTPSQDPPLGSNKQGKNLFFLLLMGAKYTIGLAFAVAALRMFFSVILGVIYGNYFMRFNRYISKGIEAFNYVPAALLAYVLLVTVLREHVMTSSYTYSFDERVLFELAILTLIALPTTTLLIGNETDYILKQEFITGVKTMGASRWHIIRKHILPHLGPRLWIQFMQQVIQVLILLIHLGFLGLFFGGTNIDKMTGDMFSVTGEWSGIIGKAFGNLLTYPWVALTPLVAFALTILAMHCILEGLTDVLDRQKVIKKSTKKKKRNTHSGTPPVSVDFTPAEKKVSGQ
ncbi:MAG TPA: ABC transporter permease subunit [Bacillales bacterium]|nr:ABC transporter permease subunit [Bacillales bacterium]